MYVPALPFFDLRTLGILPLSRPKAIVDNTRIMRIFERALPLFVFCISITPSAFSYSVLSHEALVDAMWDVQLRPYLLKNYPNATAADLKRAHGFAYGGAILQDLGYYPHGSPEFSDLTHYVRTGDFIIALLKEAHDLDELAFALGALSHYVGDLEGHKEGTNIGEPILYPKLAKKFGKVVTYEDDPAAHLKTEFAFDVLEVARGNFAPESYHDFIGFFVAKDLVGRAFHDTYGLDLSDLFGSFDSAVSGYRTSASKIIPLATRVAWAQKKDEIQRAEPGMTHRRFIYIMKRSSYEKEWGKRVQQPSASDKFLALLLKLIPPIGPLRYLRFKIPTPAVEQLFMASFNSAVQQYAIVLNETIHKDLSLPDRNYDTGDFSPPGAYRLNDQTHAFWLHKLAETKYAGLTPEIKADLLAFYSDPNAPNFTKRKPQEWQQTLNELAPLKTIALKDPGTSP